MGKVQKQFKELLKNSRPLTDEEVQELRNKAKKYAESGGKYLDKQETKQFLLHTTTGIAIAIVFWIIGYSIIFS